MRGCRATSFTSNWNAWRRRFRSRGRSSCAHCARPSTRCYRRDVDLADEVIAFDDEIDRRYHALQQGIEALLALQTPVAVDLRLVLAMLHVNLHLERMGDHCVTIAKLTKLSQKLTSDDSLVAGFEDVAGARRGDDPGRARLVRERATSRGPRCSSTSTS